MSHTQKDLYQNAGRSESGKTPVNLYGGKFYRRETQSSTIWTKTKDMKEKKSGWNTLKKAIFTPIGVQGYPNERRRSREKCLPQNKEPDLESELSSDLESLQIQPSDSVSNYRDPSLSYLDPCPSYHQNSPSICWITCRCGRRLAKT